MIYKNEYYKKILTNEGGTTYLVSKSGKVISVKKNIHELKVFETDKGYMYVKFTINKKSKAKFIHRLVAESYIDNPFDKPEVNHKDGNKHNNCVSNLEWVTSKENKKHAKDMGLIKYKYGEDKGSKYTEKTIRKACKMMEENKISLKEISKKLNVSLDLLYSIRSKRCWINISKNYSFPSEPIVDNSHDIKIIKKICKDLEKGLSLTKISKKYNVSISSVSDIKHKRRHKDISKNYNF